MFTPEVTTHDVSAAPGSAYGLPPNPCRWPQPMGNLSRLHGLAGIAPADTPRSPMTPGSPVGTLLAACSAPDSPPVGHFEVGRNIFAPGGVTR